MILYFTGTGNSRYVAQALAELLGDEAVSLNTVLKEGKAPEFHSEKPFVVVSPIHTWRLPDVVTELLARSSLTGSRQLYFVATMEADTGNTDRRCRELAHDMGMAFMGFTGIRMPNNCVYMSAMPTEQEARAMIEASWPRIREVATAIAQGLTIAKTDTTSMAGLKSGGLMHAFYRRFIMSDKDYAAGDACTDCGTCAKVCPLGNVELSGGRPRFKGNCCACYACIQHCPQAAIEIKGHTEGHGRYLCPAYDGVRD